MRRLKVNSYILFVQQKLSNQSDVAARKMRTASIPLAKERQEDGLPLGMYPTIMSSWDMHVLH